MLHRLAVVSLSFICRHYKFVNLYLNTYGSNNFDTETPIPSEEDEEEEDDNEALEPNKAPRDPFHNFLRSIPLISMFPTFLVLIEVFVMICIIETYTFLEVFVR